MKIILICLLFAACSVQKPICNDPEDQCQWTFRSTKDSVNIFIKKGNVLQWFHPAGMTEFYVQLDSYSSNRHWFNYIAWGTPSAHIFWQQNEVIIMDYSYSKEKDFL